MDFNAIITIQQKAKHISEGRFTSDLGFYIIDSIQVLGPKKKNPPNQTMIQLYYIKEICPKSLKTPSMFLKLTTCKIRWQNIKEKLGFQSHKNNSTKGTEYIRRPFHKWLALLDNWQHPSLGTKKVTQPNYDQVVLHKRHLSKLCQICFWSCQHSKLDDRIIIINDIFF